ncbi:cyclic nucleotide-binding domain-containing protein [Burkholderia sp. S171]|uniref:cyclic nucleotide-binding domain-containing protein n=1 Tax=Burkholderia sp. S171 TaxID=1641860 RepID=UPI00131C89B2|nr:cyclic nucleotide-binding domain-containing protein [Burkholderia sp. S171]
MHQEKAPQFRAVAAGEVVYSEGFAGNACIYVIAEGKIEISTKSDEKRVVLAILGKDECFGECALLRSEPRGTTARALSFCRLIVIDPTAVEVELERVSPVLRHLMRSLIRRNKRVDEILPANTNVDPSHGIVSYANLLSLMARAESHDASRHPNPEHVSISFADVFKQCQAIIGHPRMHIVAMLKRMETLNLIAFETARGNFGEDATSSTAGAAAERQVVAFNPARIIESAQRIADHSLGISIVTELEQAGLTNLDALIGIERQLLLDKLSREDKDVPASSKKPPRSTSEYESLADIEFIDDRTLFDTVDAFDPSDLAKMLLAATDRAISERLLWVMTRARQHEVSRIIRSNPVIDPVEIEDINRKFMRLLKSIKTGAIVPSTRLSI